MLMEKENWYFILLLDKYMRQVQVIDPQEISHGEFKKEQGGLGNIEKMTEAEADRLFRKYKAETKIKKDEYDKYHKYNFKVVNRLTLVFEVLLGEKFENGNRKWPVNLVPDVPKVERGESPIAALRLAFLYDGSRFIEDIDHFDDELEYLKDEALYRLLLNEKNETKPAQMGDEIRKLFSNGED